jgi:hypothetical protein
LHQNSSANLLRRPADEKISSSGASACNGKGIVRTRKKFAQVAETLKDSSAVQSFAEMNFHLADLRVLRASALNEAFLRALEKRRRAARTRTLARRRRPSRTRSVWSAARLPPLFARTTPLVLSDAPCPKAVLKPPHSKRWRDCGAASRTRQRPGVRPALALWNGGAEFGSTAAQKKRGQPSPSAL